MQEICTDIAGLILQVKKIETQQATVEGSLNNLHGLSFAKEENATGPDSPNKKGVSTD